MKTRLPFCENGPVQNTVVEVSTRHKWVKALSTSAQIWTPFYYPFMCKKNCCMSGKQCSSWSDATFCGMDVHVPVNVCIVQ